jgi:hypothetical protein
MRARILYTNGQKTTNLVWIEHNGTDVYSGVPGFPVKSSYHESGKYHTDSNGERQHHEMQTPLKELKTDFSLGTIAFMNSKEYFEVVSDKFLYTGKKGDVTLTVDSRTLPENLTLNIQYGLLPAGRLDLLQAAISGISSFTSVKQVLVATSVEPYVYALLILIPEDKKEVIEGKRETPI